MRTYYVLFLIIGFIWRNSSLFAITVLCFLLRLTSYGLGLSYTSLTKLFVCMSFVMLGHHNR